VARILLAGTKGAKVQNRKDLIEVWDETTQVYNELINDMRIHLGIDTLSQELLQLMKEKKTQSLVVSKFTAST